jgi:hypothetical protein
MMGKILLAVVLLILATLPGVHGKSEEARMEISFEPQPQVGLPSTARIEVQDAATGKAISEVQLRLQIIVPHARARMLSGDFYSPDGKLEFLYNFQDAETHVFTVTASPTDGTPVEFKPFSESYAVEVSPPGEPQGAWAKTWIILMGVLLAGIGIGYFATKRALKI